MEQRKAMHPIALLISMNCLLLPNVGRAQIPVQPGPVSTTIVEHQVFHLDVYFSAKFNMPPSDFFTDGKRIAAVASTVCLQNGFARAVGYQADAVAYEKLIGKSLWYLPDGAGAKFSETVIPNEPDAFFGEHKAAILEGFRIQRPQFLLPESLNPIVANLSIGHLTAVACERSK